MLLLEQPARSDVDGKVAAGDADSFLDLGDGAAARIARHRHLRFDVDSEHRAVTVRSQHYDEGAVDENGAGARSFLVYRGSPESGGFRSRDSGGPRSNSGGSQTLLKTIAPH